MSFMDLIPDADMNHLANKISSQLSLRPTITVCEFKDVYILIHIRYLH